MSDISILFSEWGIPKNVGVNENAVLTYGREKFKDSKLEEFEKEVKEFYQYVEERGRVRREMNT